MENIKLIRLQSKKLASNYIAQAIYDIFGSMPSNSTMSCICDERTCNKLKKICEKSEWFKDSSEKLIVSKNIPGECSQFKGDLNVRVLGLETLVESPVQSDIIIIKAFGYEKADSVWKAFFTELESTKTALETKIAIVVLDEAAASTIMKKEGTTIFSTLEDIDEAIYRIVPYQ